MTRFFKLKKPSKIKKYWYYTYHLVYQKGNSTEGAGMCTFYDSFSIEDIQKELTAEYKAKYVRINFFAEISKEEAKKISW